MKYTGTLLIDLQHKGHDGKANILDNIDMNL